MKKNLYWFLPCFVFVILCAFVAQRKTVGSISVVSRGNGQALVSWQCSSVGTSHLTVMDMTSAVGNTVWAGNTSSNNQVVSNLASGHIYRYVVTVGGEWIVNEDVYH